MASQQASGGAQPGKGKRVFVTGGNAGIGFETARGLLENGFEVTIAGRDDNRNATAKAKLEREVSGAVVHTCHLDLLDLASVREVAARLCQQEPIDVLINNAGIMQPGPRILTKDGFEAHLGIYLGHYALTALLIPHLLSANKPVRIINLSSATHQLTSLKPENLMREKNYSSWEAYSRAKLAIIMWTYDLSRRLQGTNITVNCVHPGTVDTATGRAFLSCFVGQFVIDRVAPVMFLKPRQGAKVSIHLATAPEAQGMHGKYWFQDIMQPMKIISSSKVSYDEDMQRRLIEESQRLTKIPPTGDAASPAYATPTTTLPFSQ